MIFFILYVQPIVYYAMDTRTPYEQTQLARYGIHNATLANDPTAPVEYITQRCEASGYVFTVTQDTLIPRIETEQLVELSLRSLKNQIQHLQSHKPIRILDVGTGSGYIGIAVVKKLATEYPNLHLELILSDISTAALKIALLNANELLHEETYKSKVTFKVVQSDLLDNIDAKTFHVVTANLPYIPSARISSLDTSVQNYEPKNALDGGQSGFESILKLLKQVPRFLEPSGSVFLEVDHTHTAEFFEKYLSQNGVDASSYTFTFYTDEFEKNRFVECKVK